MKKSLFKIISVFAAMTSPIAAYDNAPCAAYGNAPCSDYGCYPDYANNPYPGNYTGIAYEDSVSVARLTTMVVVSVAVIAIIAVTLSSSNCKHSH